MPNIRDAYDNISDITSLRSYGTDTNDGENTFLEFKAIRGDAKILSNLKSLIAKEMSAFANTSDGILCIGIEKNDGKLCVNNEYEGNLDEFLDSQLSQLLEPNLAGYDYKKISTDNGDFATIFIPKSISAPHRTSKWKGAKPSYQTNFKRYYMRSGSNSVEMPESLVRLMYQNEGRVIDVDVYAEISELSREKMVIRTMVKPDSFRFIDKYMLRTRAAFLCDSQNNFNYHWAVNYKSGSAWFNATPMFENRMNKTDIYPDNKPFGAYKAVASNEDRGLALLGGDEICLGDRYSLVLALYVETEFACEGVPKKTNRQLFMLGDINAYDTTLLPSFINYPILDILELPVFSSSDLPEAAYIDDITNRQASFSAGNILLSPIKTRIDDLRQTQ